MKIPLLWLPLLALAPVVATAQPQTVPQQTIPRLTIDPAAQALLDQATATYKAAKGIRFKVEASIDGKVGSQNSVAFARPNLLRLENKDSPDQQKTVGDGTSLYIVRGTSFQKLPATDINTQNFVDLNSAGQSGRLIGIWLRGRDPLAQFHQPIKSPTTRSSKLSVSALPPQMVDGNVATGVRMNFLVQSFRRGKLLPPQRWEITLWFGSNSTLRHFQFIPDTSGGKPTLVLRERVFNQQLNPTFAPDTFKFDPTGLTLANPAAP